MKRSYICPNCYCEVEGELGEEIECPVCLFEAPTGQWIKPEGNVDDKPV